MPKFLLPPVENIEKKMRDFPSLSPKQSVGSGQQGLSKIKKTSLDGESVYLEENLLRSEKKPYVLEGFLRFFPRALLRHKEKERNVCTLQRKKKEGRAGTERTRASDPLIRRLVFLPPLFWGDPQ